MVKSLLLGDKVLVSARPELEVLDDRVSCIHGCASGSLDEQQLLYLRARGLSMQQAKRLLIDGFLGAF